MLPEPLPPEPLPPDPLLLERLVPAFVATSESFGDIEDARPLGAEQDAVSAADPKRVREFSTGRHLARTAIQKLGLAPTPLKRLADGSCDWPDLLRGSITHCEGYRGAAVALAARTAGIGIDAEPATALPPGVLDLIATGMEQERVHDLAAADPTINWDTVLFSTKEACLKAWLSANRGYALQLDDIHVSLEGSGSFGLQRVAGFTPEGCRGSYCVRRGLVICALTLPQPLKTQPPRSA